MLTHQNVATFLGGGLDLVSDIAIGQLQIVTGVAGVVHEGEVAIVHVQELERWKKGRLRKVVFRKVSWAAFR